MKRFNRFVLRGITLAIILMFAQGAHAQSGILAPSRYEQWARATVGVPGGIPTTWTQCGSTIAAYGTSGSPASPATINNAIASCGSNQYVMLGAGTFWLNAGILIQRSNVMLVGSGPKSTTIEFTNGVACISGAQNVCFLSNSSVYPGGFGTTPPSPPSTSCLGSNNCFNWTGGFTQGATAITIANVGTVGILNGDMIGLDQANDLADTGGQMTCDALTPTASINCHVTSETGGYNGRQINGTNYSQVQFVRVVSGCSSTCTGAGPFSLTITPGLYANNWNGTGAPGGFFLKPNSNIGIENITLDNTNGTATSNIGMYGVDSAWVKNVRSIEGNRNHVWTLGATHYEIRDSYFFGILNSSSESYGVELGMSGDGLVENNIFQQITAPFIGAGAMSGVVYGYNFGIDHTYQPSDYMQPAYGSHDPGNEFNLYEGNEMNSISWDNTHGTAALDTAFRNWLTGRGYNTCPASGGCSPPNNFANQPTQQTSVFSLASYDRGENIIGNVLGTPGYHTQYSQTGGGTTPSLTNCNLSIYWFGFGSPLCNNGVATGVADDTKASSTAMLWGNYDVVNAAVRFNSGESSPGAVTYIGAQTTPSSHTLPASFYLASRPAFFTTPQGALAYPIIGPDVTSGNGSFYTSGTYSGGMCPVGLVAGGATCPTSNVGGFANLNPAANCYYNVLSGAVDGSGSVLAFDANTCYTSSGPVTPTAPTNLPLTFNIVVPVVVPPVKVTPPTIPATTPVAAYAVSTTTKFSIRAK